jgi:hypothetical protein
VLAAIVTVVRRFEQVRAAPVEARSVPGNVAAGAAVVHLAIGLLVLAGTVITTPFTSKVVLGGLHVVSLIGFVHVGVATILVRGTRQHASAMLLVAAAATAVTMGLAWSGAGPIGPLPGLAAIEGTTAAAMLLGALIGWLAPHGMRSSR